ncbi:MAG: DUF885 domain-containing protein [Steroidobacteraceae bacterium]
MERFFHSAPLGLIMLTLAACGAAPAPPPSTAVKPAAPGDRLSQLVEHYWDDYGMLNPQRLPQGAVTRFEAAGGYEISAQFLADSLALERRYLAAARAMQRPSLDADSRVTYDIFTRERELAVASFTYPSELLPVNPARSMPLLFAQTATGAGPYAVLSAMDFDNWQARADAYVQWTHEAIANMREGLRRGYTLPRVLVEEMLPILAGLGADTPANVFYQPVAAIPATAADAERSRLSKGISAGVRDKILPSYRALHDFLRNEYLPRARATVGLSVLPLGQSWYAFLVKREAGTAMAPAEIHALGKAEVERIHGRLQALLAGTAFAGDEHGFLAAMRSDPHWSYKTTAELLNFYNELKVQSAAALASQFAQAPRADFAIRPVENFRENWAPPLFYQRATPNGTTAAVLYVNTAGIETQPITATPAGFLRAALPGHHYQLALQQERADLPRFRRYGGDPAFVEGWGLYAASLGEDLGLYRDTQSRFEALIAELQCAAGLVIDTGVHSQGWTRQQAIEYLQSKAPIDEPTVRAIVDRAIALPGEALACAMGARKIQALRARAAQTLGPAFDIRAFHFQVLDGGAMPLDILESKVNLWLDGVR